MSPEEFARDWVRLDRVFDIEAKCRAAFDNEFHKIPASMTYDQWRLAFKTGWRESAAHPKELQPATVQLVDAWFSLNTGLGGCSDEDVAALAAIFYGTNPPPLDFDQQLTNAYAEGRKDEHEDMEGTCPSCKGSGTQIFYGPDPDWPSEEGQCERCGGTGAIAAAPAAPQAERRDSALQPNEQPKRMCANAFSQHPGQCAQWCGDDRTCPIAPDNIRDIDTSAV